MSFGITYNVFVCDKSYTKLCAVDTSFVQYSQVVNSVTQAYFTVPIQSPSLGSISFDPINKAYCCIIEREGTEVFRGELDLLTTPGKKTPLGFDPHVSYNTLDEIGFNASGQERRLDDIVVNPDSDSSVYKRSFNSVALGTAVQTLIQEAIAKPNSPVSDMSVGSVENPVDNSGATITLTSTQALYANTTLQWIKTLADLGKADWYRSGQTLNFVKRKGTDRSGTVVLRLNNLNSTSPDLLGITLNIDRTKMANSIVVVGAQDGINQIVKSQTNSASISNFGLRERVIPIRIIDTETTAQQYADSTVARLSQSIPLDSIQIYPSQSHTPFGDFSLGDTITVDVNINFIQFRRRVRVMGAVISVNDDGVERIYYSFQEPYD